MSLVGAWPENMLGGPISNTEQVGSEKKRKESEKQFRNVSQYSRSRNEED